MPDWYPWPDHPGYGIFCQAQAHVVSAMHDVVVLAWRVENGLRKRVDVSEAYEDGMLTFRIRLRPTSVPKLEYVYKLFGCLMACSRLLRHHRWVPDVIHAHEYRAGLLALFLGSLVRAPLVVSEHNTAFPRGVLERRDLLRARIVFRRAAVVAPVSLDLAQVMSNLTKDTRVVTVPPSVDPSLFRPDSRRSADVLTLVSVGRLVVVKGHRYLIDALKALEIAGVDARLHIVGDGDLRRALEAQVDDLGLTGRVTFHGYLPKHEIAEVMRGSDIFVLPSLWENLPSVVLEALASGLPVVATRVGGVPEIVDAEAGVLLDPASPTALADAIVEVAHNLHRYDRDVLHQRAASRYGPDAVAQLWTEVYELALAEKRTSDP
jgi:glycosyltransferase involved in cell wall biosynthesis